MRAGVITGEKGVKRGCIRGENYGALFDEMARMTPLYSWTKSSSNDITIKDGVIFRHTVRNSWRILSFAFIVEDWSN